MGLGTKKVSDGPDGDGGCHVADLFAASQLCRLDEFGSPGARHVAAI